jgi:hypothetical protein
MPYVEARLRLNLGHRPYTLFSSCSFSPLLLSNKRGRRVVSINLNIATAMLEFGREVHKLRDDSCFIELGRTYTRQYIAVS